MCVKLYLKLPILAPTPNKGKGLVTLTQTLTRTLLVVSRSLPFGSLAPRRTRSSLPSPPLFSPRDFLSVNVCLAAWLLAFHFLFGIALTDWCGWCVSLGWSG